MQPRPLASVVFLPVIFFLLWIILDTAFAPVTFPPLALVAVIWLGWSRNSFSGLMAGLIAGFLEDFLLAPFFGAGMFCNALLGFSAGVLRTWFWREGRQIFVGWAGAACAVRVLFDAVIFVTSGGRWAGWTALPAAIFFESIMAAACAWMVYPILKKITARPAGGS